MAGALERRVWTESALSRVYANLYVLLVAPPGVGKSVAIFQGRALTEQTKKLKVSPDDVTKASLIDHLSHSEQTKIYGPKDMLQYHAMQVFADEFGVLCPSHDTAFLSVMNALYDNRAMYKESRRGRESDLVIHNPQVNLLAGTQPDFLANFLPPEAWGMGFMSRMLMVYQGKSIRPRLFGKRVRIDTRSLFDDLNTICELHGEVSWEEDAENHLVSWYEGGMEPQPEHSKLKHYVARRILTVLKLCIVSTAARSNSMVVDKTDVERAIDWLLEIEALMPEVFKDMSGNSDLQIIQDVHYYLWDLYNKSDKDPAKRKPIHRSKLEVFLSARTPGYNVEVLMNLMKRNNIIQEVMPDHFKPGTTNMLKDE